MSEITAGFADQALDSARSFRLMLDAMARPGSIMAMPAALDAPPPLLPTAATIVLTLCDYDTPLWLDETYRTSAVLDYLRFHTGAPMVEEISAASFILCGTATSAAALAPANPGTAEYPDTSATVIVQLSTFRSDEYLTLEGPGIDGSRVFSTCGLAPLFWDRMADNSTLFPLGSDVFFAAASEIAAIPRSTRLKR